MQSSTHSTKSYEAHDDDMWDDLSDIMPEIQREGKREALRRAARDQSENLQRETREREDEEAKVRQERCRQGGGSKGVVQMQTKREKWGFGVMQPLGWWL
jgi:hypothetical protein